MWPVTCSGPRKPRKIQRLGHTTQMGATGSGVRGHKGAPQVGQRKVLQAGVQQVGKHWGMLPGHRTELPNSVAHTLSSF